MKRGRGDTLTGGTGDVNPQILSLNEVDQPGTDQPGVITVGEPAVSKHATL